VLEGEAERGDDGESDGEGEREDEREAAAD